MASNYQVQAQGLGFWQESSQTVSFDGQEYTIAFVQLRPERLEELKVEVIDDHTAELTVQDPNGLV